MTIAIALLAFSMVGQAPAQNQVPPQEGGRPPMMRRPMGGPTLLFAPDVQKELGLSDDQRQKLAEILGGRQGGPGGPPPGQGGPGGPPPGQGGPGGPPPGQGGPGGPPPGQGGPGGPPPGQGGPGGYKMPREAMEKLAEENDAKIKGVLSSSQYTRYHQLELQFRGPSSLLEKKVGAAVGLTEEQRNQILAVLESGRQNWQPPHEGQRPSPEDMDRQRQEVDRKILAVLDQSQLDTWTSMLGKPFAFQRRGGRGGN
ncbi:MAG: hypothetical protein JNM34_01340 [Chthonomonadaceae bacterium]|nr:hypothetical protein [Chthonomonadaceae bacterium]